MKPIEHMTNAELAVQTHKTIVQGNVPKRPLTDDEWELIWACIDRLNAPLIIPEEFHPNELKNGDFYPAWIDAPKMPSPISNVQKEVMGYEMAKRLKNLTAPPSLPWKYLSDGAFPRPERIVLVACKPETGRGTYVQFAAWMDGEWYVIAYGFDTDEDTIENVYAFLEIEAPGVR